MTYIYGVNSFLDCAFASGNQVTKFMSMYKGHNFIEKQVYWWKIDLPCVKISYVAALKQPYFISCDL